MEKVVADRDPDESDGDVLLEGWVVGVEVIGCTLVHDTSIGEDVDTDSPRGRVPW